MKRLLALFTLALQACATTSNSGTGSSSTEDRFPSREVVASIAAKPVAGPLFSEDLLTLDTYTFTPPEIRNEGPWLTAFRAAAATREGLVTVSDDVGCVAAGAGQFLLEHGKLPALHLRDFIEARCGASVSEVSYRYLTLTSVGETDEAALYERFRESWGKMVAEHVSQGGGVRAGHVFFGRAGDKALAMVVTGRRRVHLTRAPRTPDAEGNIVLEGELLEPAGRYEALVNYGVFARPCVQDSSVELPRFRVSCAVDVRDASTRIELGAFPAGQVLGSSLYQMLAFPAGTPVDTYQRRRVVAAEGAPAESQLSPRERFLALLNTHRAAAGIGALTLAQAQSELSAKLAPHYFVYSQRGGEERLVADRIVLGLLAGWDVEGVVRDGRLTSQSYPTRDVAELLETMLARPGGRVVLMGKEHTHLALGEATDPQVEMMGMIATAFELFDGSKLNAHTQELYQHLAKLRRDRGLPPMMAIEGGKQAVVNAVDAVQKGSLNQDRALDRLLASTAARLRLPAQGWWMTVSRLEDLQIPAEILTAQQLGVELAVAFRREPGEAWGRYVVMIVMVKPENDMQQASLPAPYRG